MGLVGRLSGIASHTRHYVDAVKHTRALILDPSAPHTELQALERYAVRCGGGHTRRPHLLEPVLITRNHVHLAGSIPAAVEYAREHLTAPLPIQLEAYTQDEARGGLDAKVDALLLHDMPPKSINQVVSRAPDTVWREAFRFQLSGINEQQASFPVGRIRATCIQIGSFRLEVDGSCYYGAINT